jgi:RimJ/RimL family protein N-acetyltransferase
MAVTVRNATLDDLDEIMALRQAVAAEGRWIGAEVPLDEDRDRAVFAASIERGSMFVAELDGEIVGNLGMEVPPYKVADLGMLVKDGHRGQGIGSALLERAIEYAREQGCHKVALQHWPHNEWARGLYEKYGFEQEGYLRRHYPRKNGELWDAVVMGLLLDG